MIIGQNHDDFKWSAHPAMERVGATISTSLVIVGIAIAIYFSFLSFFFSLVSLFVLIFSLNRFYFPSYFLIDQEGITAKYLFTKQHYQWREVKRFIHDRHGGYLSYRAHSSRLDAFRGMNILFNNHRKEIIHRIKTHIQKETPLELV